MAVISAQITDAGVVSPDYADILAQLKNLYWSLYGSDAILDDDSMDGQFLGALARIIYDQNQSVVAAYSAFSPATAQGNGLSSVVKINGLRRQVASRSTAQVTVGGQFGTVINNGRVSTDLAQQTLWALPETVTIPEAGEIVVTATCTEDGAVPAPAATLVRIATPTRGWQTVTNVEAAALGDPVESDATLRRRQSQSTALPAQSVVGGLYGALAQVPGVQKLQVYENDTDATDGDGIPSHSISAVVLGGDAQTIAATIADQKTPGTGTYGDITELVVDSRGVPISISFFNLSQVNLVVEVDIDPLTGYSSATGTLIRQAILDFITNEMEIGEDSYLSRLSAAASLGGTGPGATFVVVEVRQGKGLTPPSAANVVFDFKEQAVSDLDSISLNLV